MILDRDHARFDEDWNLLQTHAGRATRAHSIIRVAHGARTLTRAELDRAFADWRELERRRTGDVRWP